MGDDRLSLADVARRIGVHQSAVSNWRRRDHTFPEVRRQGGADTVDVEAVRAWLARRRVPRNALRAGEQAGATYDSRFDGVSPRAFHSEPAGVPDQGDDLSADLDRLGRDVPAGVSAQVIAALLGLKHRAPGQWQRIVAGEVPESHLVGSRLTSGPAPGLQVLDRIPALLQPDRHVRRLVQLVDAMRVDPTKGGPSAYRMLSAINDRWPGLGGDVTTPSFLADLMARLVAPRPGEHVHDVFGRSGEILLAVAGCLIRTGEDAADASYSAYCASEEEARATQVGAALLGFPVVCVRRPADVDPRSADVVVGNPPFNVAGWLDGVSGHAHWGELPDRSNLRWLQHGLGRLRPGGRAAILTATISASSENSAERHVRGGMIESGVIAAVIELPQRMFAGTDVGVTLWLLRRPRQQQDSAPVLFIDATELGTVEKGRRVLAESDIWRMVDEFGAWSGGDSRQRFRGTPGFSIALEPEAIERARYALAPRALVPDAPRDADPRGRSRHLDDIVERLDGARTALAAVDGAASDAARWLVRAAGQESGVGHRRTVLGDVAQLRAGRRVDAAGVGGVPVLLPRHVVGPVVRADATDRGSPDHERILRSGDIVGTRVGSIGHFALVGDAHDGWLLSQGLFRLRPGADVDGSYLVFALRGGDAQRWIEKHVGGSAVKSLSLATLAQLPLVLPPTDEQRRVGRALAEVVSAAAAHHDVSEVLFALAAASLPDASRFAVPAGRGDSEDDRSPHAGR